MREEADDIGVSGHGAVEGAFELELFGAEAAGAEGVGFVDEFYGDDGGGFVGGAGFADARSRCVRGMWERRVGGGVRGICAGADGLGDESEG